ncbi:MAG: PAS domain-containing protein, partial [Rhodospirillales bacterium]|nr:PAS domain-containing protein [Rhodospirillales bacterium]
MAESEARFRALIDHSPNAIFLKDREGRYLVANKTLADRCGTAIGNLIGKTAHDFFPTETAKQFETRERRVAKSGESRSDRQKAVFPDGKTRILNIVRFPVPGVDGRRTAMGCISQDITDQVRAEEALQEEHNLLQTVLENIPHAVYWKERNLTYAGCNSVYAKTWGLRRRDVIGKTFQDLSPNPQEADAIATLDRQVLSGRSLVDFEDTRTDPNGTVKVHLSSKVPLLDSLGRSRGVLGIFTDITERKRTEEILRRSQKLQSLGNLAGGMAHEINNLLLPITTLTQMTIKHMADGSAEQTRLKKVHEAAARAASIIRKVMEFTRQDTRDRKRMDPREIIERAIRIVSSTLPATVELQRQLARDIGRIEVNPDDFTVVISNLVANGVDALSGKPGNLRISLQKKRVDARHAASIGGLEPGKHALVRIADTGCGMPPETVRRAPDPFFTTKEVGEGSGLGLSVAHGIVE